MYLLPTTPNTASSTSLTVAKWSVIACAKPPVPVVNIGFNVTVQSNPAFTIASEEVNAPSVTLPILCQGVSLALNILSIPAGINLLLIRF